MKGKVYGCGSGTFGQIGSGDKSFFFRKPTFISSLSPASTLPSTTATSSKTLNLQQPRNFFFGLNHSFFWLANNLWSWGDGRFGQLGHGDISTQTSPLLIEDLAKKLSQKSHVDIPLVSAGYYHSLVAIDSDLYTFGDGRRGALASGDEQSKCSPFLVQIESNENQPLLHLSAGCDFSLAINESHQLFAWGGNDQGQLGLGHLIDQWKPKKNDFFLGKKIKSISSGWGHVILCTEDNELFAWGSNNHGQCGHSQEKIAPIPRKITLPESEKSQVHKVIASSSTSAVLLENGSLYIWGSHRDGKLGMGNDIKEDLHLPTKLPFPQKIVDVAMGTDHVVIIAADHSIWVWGYGQHGALGIEDCQDRFSPTEVNRQFLGEGEKISEVHCGMDYSVFII
eukprot:TRINITY_DN7559_c0_g1_i1.p1 TRINITY_DN7559_c0_g1~~TRINITY_DN7559_c0_g1_i1.p1  ORF type:complete len:395 (-),score=75.34 TRINITY_DN7559_c0_g1_i1:85-1269(-)